MSLRSTSEQPTEQASSPVDDFFEMSLDNACVAGFDGYFRRVNPSWTRTLGWSEEELLAKPVVWFAHPDDRADLLASRQRLVDGQNMGPLVNRYRCKDGSYRWFEWRSSADPDRELVYAVARDITEQKHTERRLEEAQKLQKKLQRQLIFADRMASVGTLAAGVAHEINNPLAYVRANLHMIIGRLQKLRPDNAGAPWEELDELVRDAKEGAGRIEKIVRGLKTFSRTEEQRFDVVDVRDVLDESLDMTANELRHRARLVKDYGEVPSVEADEARLEQVFVNLLVNAAQAIADGRAAANEVRVRTATDAAGRAVVEVSDTGCGIASADLSHIFDPFFTTKPVGVGTGLGLFVCHNIVTGMGGEISVTSAAGQGTTFRMVLPPVADTRPDIPARAPHAGDTTGADHITDATDVAVLVVDDEPAIGRIFQRILSAHDVTTVTTATDALALLDAGEHYHIIFSDLLMPEMSGMEFYVELAARHPATAARVVFISGGAFTPSAHTFLERVPNVVLDKPFDPAAVRDLVARHAAAKR